MKQKTKKILNTIVNVIVAVILVMVAFVTINIIVSGNKGYTSLFGTAFVAVESDSMKGESSDNFSKGDMLFIRVLSDDEKNSLQVGDIITFYDTINGKQALNTHRIVEVVAYGTNSSYRTAGDNNVGLNGEVTWDSTVRYADNIVGIYTGKIPAIGSVVSFFHTTAGFFICVVLPALLIVAYCAYSLFKAVKQQRDAAQSTKEDEMRAKILAELQQQGKINAEAVSTENTSAAESTTTNN